MAFVGDVILGARAQAPDLPPTLAPPSISSLTAINFGGGSLPPATYFIVLTAVNQWGETLASNELSVVVTGPNNAIQIVWSLGAIGLAPLSGINTRVYIGTAAGAEQFYIPVSSTPSTITISSFATGIAGSPPSRATAYLPDMDGPQVSASVMFGWLNEGLKKLSRITGGLLDYAGVPTQAGNPLYVLPGEWLKITDVWYGGYWVQGGKRGDFFRRNAVTTQILTGVVISMFTDRQVIEVSYQPDRNAGQTTTSAGMAATDTSVPIANPSAFLLPFGFAQIGTEIVAYSSLGLGAMGGLIRSVGSASPAVAWPSGTVVKELPLFWCGRRVFGTTYSPGQANLNLPVPDGWDAILKLYVLGCFRETEQDDKNAERLYKQFAQEGESWMNAHKGVVSFVQVGGANVPQTYANTPAGGLILP